MIKVHLYGAFYGCRAALRHMQPRRSGAIVNISSVLGLYTNESAPDYSVAKSSIIALTKAAAYETAHLGIRVNAVCPGYVDTPLLTPLSESIKAMITTRIPLGRMAHADELAEMVRFLVGPEASYCTGEIISVSGGYHG
jgi:3-oxoacyl-[acyl-carrier protein] reductase